MKCPYCGTENPAEVNFCDQCGGWMNLLTASGSEEGSANTRSLTRGSSLQDGRYVIKRILGQGGMGSVFLATDTRLTDKTVVIKVLISDHTDPARLGEDVRNFRHEVGILAHIDHPLVPGVTDHFQEGSRYFMVQEYVEGENLQERLDRLNQPMREDVALRYALEVLDILDYLAQQVPAIVHRDIKPANIIIGVKDRRAHLVDFGIARAHTPSLGRRKQTTALGTPGYAPPEQYRGHADPRSDLYALAATLHHLLTNRDPRDYPPFVYPPVCTLNPRLSPDIEAVLARALMLDVNQRYQSAKEMKRDIEDVVFKHFGLPGDTSSYRLRGLAPIRGIPGSGQLSQPIQVNQSVQVQQQMLVPPMPRPIEPRPVPPYQPMDMYDGQQSPTGSNVGFNFLLFVLVIFLIALAIYVAMGFVSGLGSVPALPL
jgi:serine/threonine protein kinase